MMTKYAKWLWDVLHPGIFEVNPYDEDCPECGLMLYSGKRMAWTSVREMCQLKSCPKHDEDDEDDSEGTEVQG
jgi:hypothetical protein